MIIEWTVRMQSDKRGENRFQILKWNSSGDVDYMFVHAPVCYAFYVFVKIKINQIQIGLDVRNIGRCLLNQSMRYLLISSALYLTLHPFPFPWRVTYQAKQSWISCIPSQTVPQWHASAAGTSKLGTRWKAQRMRGPVIPVTALCRMDSLNTRLLYVFVHVSLCSCRNAAIQTTAPLQGYPAPYIDWDPLASCLE